MNSLISLIEKQGIILAGVFLCCLSTTVWAISCPTNLSEETTACLIKAANATFQTQYQQEYARQRASTEAESARFNQFMSEEESTNEQSVHRPSSSTLNERPRPDKKPSKEPVDGASTIRWF